MAERENSSSARLPKQELRRLCLQRYNFFLILLENHVKIFKKTPQNFTYIKLQPVFALAVLFYGNVGIDVGIVVAHDFGDNLAVTNAADT